MKNKQSILYIIPKETYYNSKENVIKEGLTLHENLLNSDRELYTYLLYFTNSTYFSKKSIIENLLSNSLYKEENSHILSEDAKRLQIEDTLILHALYNENITHALKMLLGLKERRINNARTQKLILEFIFGRGNTDLIAIKYKQKLKQLIGHALGVKVTNEILRGTKEGKKYFDKYIKPYGNPYAHEVFEFVFDKGDNFKSEYLQEYRRMQMDFKNNKVDFRRPTTLPIEVLAGFNSQYKRNYTTPMLLGIGKVSNKQKIQMQNRVKRESNNTVEIKIDFNQYSIIDLFKYMYNKIDITKNEIETINEIIDEKAAVIRGKINDSFDLSDTAIILDASDSNAGSSESKSHPLFKNMALARVLSKNNFFVNDNLYLAGGVKDENGLLKPLGHTDLASALLDVAEDGYRNVILLSDGFENVGSFDKVHKQLKEIGYDINITHFNPVFSPKDFSFKMVSDDILAMPFSDEKDIEYLSLFCLLNTDEEAFKKVLRKKIEDLL